MTTAVTWWGHATTTIELAGRRILTDPVLGRRVAHLTRVRGPLPGLPALRADVVLVSHLHHDHLHVRSLQLLGRQVRIVAPSGSAGVLRRAAPALARRVEEVDPGDILDLGGVGLLVVPAVHEGRRSPVSRHLGPALGFVLEAGDERVWFAGDTGLFPAMAGIGPVDLAVVPIGGWGPTLGATHLDPAQAAEAVRRVGAVDAVPVHYGTFWPIGLRRAQPASFRRHFTEPADTFTSELARVCPRTRAHVLAPGETVTVAGRRQ